MLEVSSKFQAPATLSPKKSRRISNIFIVLRYGEDSRDRDLVVFRTATKIVGTPLWSSGQSSWQLTQRSRVRFPALPDFLSSSGSGTGFTQLREDK
jgi:hypothetical protein